MSNRRLRINHILSVSLSLMLFAAPGLAQQPVTQAPQKSAQLNEITFDDLLAVDAFKMYGEVRNVGQLLGNGGAGEIIEPIIKLAEPGKEFQSIIDFLKKNSEALTSSRLMFATWPTRTDLPNVFVAIEFPTKDEADKFAPKLETFLPTVLPPVPVTPEASPEAKPKTTASPAQSSVSPAASSRSAKPASSPPPREERLPFVITHSGSLVFIADKAFKFEKLHPHTAQSLFRDPNFRTVHDKFTSEPIFFFFNVALEDKSKPQPSPTSVISEAQEARIKTPDKDDSPDEPPRADNSPAPTPQERQTAVLIAGPEPSPAPTPTKEQEAQAVASRRVGQLLDAIGYGEPQWPEAVGLAIELSGSEYVVRALMIDKPEAKRTPIPFVPQLLSGSPYATEAASVLPDDTDIFVSASIDLTKTYEGMKKEAETRAKAELGRPKSQRYENGVLVEQGPVRTEVTDPFAEFETKAGFKIKDDLLSVLGNEVALAGSLKTLMGAGFVNLGIRTDSTSANESSGDKSKEEKKPESAIPVLLIEVRDRDAVRKLMPKVLTGLGIGEANLIAQTERRGDTEMVNYAGVFAYGFVGNFLVISDATSVRKVIDANVNSQTLSSNTVFRNSRRWESSRTLGQLYVSPALMQSYHDQIRKQAASMDQAMRDFLLALDPRSEAITYALSNDGPGMQHELHLPKNLILTMVAGISSSVKNPPPETNEGIAIALLQFIANSEAQYKAGPGKGSYASLQQMIDAKMFPADVAEKYGYNFQVTVTGDQFEAVATPREYGRTGKRSFFVDKSDVVRGGDHGGGAATIADPPAQP
ncbi:MAG TPA: hypothetical protein VNG71_18800 [Pyrinomonadaceae bacterium]|nr:hypothetical protein [Pyrinomonadaceae bacterium]